MLTASVIGSAFTLSTASPPPTTRGGARVITSARPIAPKRAGRRLSMRESISSPPINTKIFGLLCGRTILNEKKTNPDIPGSLLGHFGTDRFGIHPGIRGGYE